MPDLLSNMKPVQMQSSDVLFHYDEIVKLSGLFILRMVRDYYAEKMAPYLDMTFLSNTSDEDLYYLYLARDVYNPFQWLAIQEFNYEKNYNYFWNKYQNMFISSEPTDIHDTIMSLMDSYFINTVYIYSESYDKRIDFDAQSMVQLSRHRHKMAYITGDLSKVIEKVNPDLIFYPNLEDILELARDHRDIAFAVPNCGFNLEETGQLRYIDKNDHNIGHYPIIQSSKAPHYFG